MDGAAIHDWVCSQDNWAYIAPLAVIAVNLVASQVAGMTSKLPAPVRVAAHLFGFNWTTLWKQAMVAADNAAIDATKPKE